MIDIAAAIDAAVANLITGKRMEVVRLDAELAALQQAPRPPNLAALEAELSALQAQNRLLKEIECLEAERMAMQENRRAREQEIVALRAQNPQLSPTDLVTLQAKKHEAELIGLDEEDSRAHKQEYRLRLRRELGTLDEELLTLKRQEREDGDEHQAGTDDPPEDLRKTWRREDSLGGLDEIEDDESSDLS